jgi:predicted NACHT family NTPase
MPLAATQKIVEVFDQPDIQGKLLILGEPGAGKTTELLHLAKDLGGRL